MDDELKFHAKRFFKRVFVIGTLLALYIVVKCNEVEAAELDQEETTTVSQEEVGADEDLFSFGYMTEPEEASTTLAKIYNLLLTMFYFFIINEGRKLIMRNLRKGHVKHGLVE